MGRRIPLYGSIIPGYASTYTTTVHISAFASSYSAFSGIQIFHNARVVFDEVAPRLNIPAYQLGEDGFCLPLFFDHRSFVRTYKKELTPCEIPEVLSKFAKNNGRN